MQRLRGGSISEDTAITELYQRHMYTLLSFIRRSVRTREDAEDVLLEVFIAAFERNALAGLSEGEQLAWLRRVAHNKCVDTYRASQRHPFLSLETVTEALYDNEDQLPEQIALDAEELALLYTRLTKLPVQTFTMGIYATDPYGFSELQYCTYPKTDICSYTIAYSSSEKTDYTKGKHTFRAFLGNIGGAILENSSSITITWS